MDTNNYSDLVFDVGAHKGEDSDFYLKLGYRVVAVEANPTLINNLKQRFVKEIGDANYCLIDKAIGDSEGVISFFINKKLSVWGTANPNWAIRNKGLGAESEEIKVESICFSDIFRKYGCPYYLKIDVEGADMLCVNTLKTIDCRPKYISIESTKTSWSDLLTEFDTFEQLGYTRFKVVNQRKHRDGEYKDRYGQLISYNFEEGATGPFGENLDGVWLTKSQALACYVPIFFLYKIIGDNTFLSKVLKHIPILRHVLGLVSWYDTHAMRK